MAAPAEGPSAVNNGPSDGQDSLALRVASVREAMAQAARRAGRDPKTVRLLAATKTVSAERLEEAVAAGLHLFGENRLQEALPKLEALQRHQIEWHFIGQLQRRKVKQVVGRFALIHSVDSVELAEEIQRRSEEAGLRQAVLLEINVGGEASKGGFEPDEVVRVAPLLAGLPNVLVMGLMTIPPPTTDMAAARGYFRALRELAPRITKAAGGALTLMELSMGMSQDFAAAIEEGATIVRVGTMLFGARPTAQGVGV